MLKALWKVQGCETSHLKSSYKQHKKIRKAIGCHWQVNGSVKKCLEKGDVICKKKN